MGEPSLVRRLLRRPAAQIGGSAVAVLVVLAMLAPWIAPPLGGGAGGHPPLAPPSWAHPCGTDELGQDVLARLLLGSRLSMTVALLGTALAVGAGTMVGAAAGSMGGLVDGALMRLTDLFLAVPRVVLLLALATFFRGSATMLVVLLAVTGWMGTARMVRGEALRVRSFDFIAAARLLGASRGWILRRHVLPNVLTPVLVTATLGVGDTLLMEAGLSYLGFGPQVGEPSWGQLVKEGERVLGDAWWISTTSGLAIVVSVLAFTLLGDELRRQLEPRRPGGARR